MIVGSWRGGKIPPDGGGGGLIVDPPHHMMRHFSDHYGTGHRPASITHPSPGFKITQY